MTRPSGEEGRCDVYCHVKNSLGSQSSNASEPTIIFGLKFKEIWQLQKTVPIYLAVVLFPLLNFKSPTFFTKFNVLGTVSVIYIICFNVVRLITCGINMDFVNKLSPNYVQNFNVHFPVFTGMLTMSYFIHNAILTMLRNQRNPENNIRDLSIAYVLVAFTYTFVAVSFYAAYPLQRDCIGDNLLDNFTADYWMSAAARLLIFFQLVTILPLILYFIRVQLSCAIYNDPWPGLTKVLILNSTIVIVGVLTAIFYPNIGHIIRYFGAFCGMMYSYALPCLVYMRSSYIAGVLSPLKLTVHSIIIIFGIVNLIAQFLIN